MIIIFIIYNMWVRCCFPDTVIERLNPGGISVLCPTRREHQREGCLFGTMSFPEAVALEINGFLNLTSNNNNIYDNYYYFANLDILGYFWNKLDYCTQTKLLAMNERPICCSLK